ncbi:ATP-binding cassette domain-containing protein [Alloscardovia venturai]
MSLQIKDLCVTIQDRAVVRGVNLTVSAHERVGLIGASGSGKSMITRALLGTLPHHAHVSGEILVDGVDILSLSDEERAELRGTYMSAVFQNPLAALNPMARVVANVELPLALHYTMSSAEKHKRAQEALESVGLSDAFLHRFPSELSGGQAQRVAIAEALVSHPQLLIADEPTTALDSLVQKQIIDVLLERISAEKSALLFISHDFNVITKTTQRCYVLCDGQIVESGETHSVLEHPSERYTQELVAAAQEISVEAYHD